MNQRVVAGVAFFGVYFVLATGGAVAMADEKEAKAADPNAAAKAFIAEHEAQIRPLEKTVALAWWNANVTGRDADFAAKEEAENRLDQSLSDTRRFARLKAIKESKASDPTLARQIEVLYLQYLEKQVDPSLLRQMTAKGNAIDKAFNVYRAKVGAEEMTDSQVRRVLSQSKDSARRKAVWEASKGVGAVVSADLIELVNLRNQAAAKLGYKNFHAMQLALNEQDQAAVVRLFDDLDELTRQPFLRAKAEIDERLAKDYGIPVGDLRPWHYHDPFFQESPAVGDSDRDAIFAKANILNVCRDFYAGIGLPIEDVLARSDLYEREGKSPHAFCTDIDREGDVRVLANIVPNEYWLATMLHELGHAVYSSKFIPDTVPYVLRANSHILTTEGVAMMFERFAKSAEWLGKAGVAVPDPVSFNRASAVLRRNQLLIFSRWCQVMLRFEVSLYNNPDQDLNGLWWDLVEKYQGLHRPDGRNAPDYASKIHVVSAPAYYHNYMMGQLFASQLHAAIARDVLKSDDVVSAMYYGDKRVGDFMKKRVFEPGRRLSWNELTKFATGADLNPRAFATEFQAD